MCAPHLWLINLFLMCVYVCHGAEDNLQELQGVSSLPSTVWALRIQLGSSVWGARVCNPLSHLFYPQ